MAEDVVTIAISGCSSSGKTSLMYLLTELLSPYFTIQQDDFHRPKTPVRADGTQDGDCVEAVDMDAFKKALRACKSSGQPPDGPVSWQNPEELKRARLKALAQFPRGELDGMKKRLLTATAGRPIGIVEGFLLFQDPELVAETNIKLVLRTTKARSKARRMKRPGYGEEGTADFWRTEEYFDKCVWHSTYMTFPFGAADQFLSIQDVLCEEIVCYVCRKTAYSLSIPASFLTLSDQADLEDNLIDYVKETGFLFKQGDVEGQPNLEICKEKGIVVQPELDTTIQQTLDWATDQIVEILATYRECRLM